MNTYRISLSATLGDDDNDMIMIIPILIEILMNIMVMMIHADSSQSIFDNVKGHNTCAVKWKDPTYETNEHNKKWKITKQRFPPIIRFLEGLWKIIEGYVFPTSTFPLICWFFLLKGQAHKSVTSDMDITSRGLPPRKASAVFATLALASALVFTFIALASYNDGGGLGGQDVGQESPKALVERRTKLDGWVWSSLFGRIPGFFELGKRWGRLQHRKPTLGQCSEVPQVFHENRWTFEGPASIGESKTCTKMTSTMTTSWASTQIESPLVYCLNISSAVQQTATNSQMSHNYVEKSQVLSMKHNGVKTEFMF